MPDRSAPIVVTPRACPFVALDGDRDRRLDTPDPLHRCFAEQIPRARSITHQAEFCLAPTFPTCPIFQDWASRAAAEPLQPRVPVATTAETATGSTGGSPTSAATAATGALPAAAATSSTLAGTSTNGAPASSAIVLDDDPALAARAAFARSLDDIDADDITTTRPVPSYRAGLTPGVAPAAATTATGSGTVTTASPDEVTGTPAADPAGDVPVIRSMPTSGTAPVTTPAIDEDWMAPPPWLREPPGPVWVMEAVPPPDALADVATQSVRRPRPTELPPSVVAEAAIPTGVEPAFGTGSFGEETTGMPPDMALGVPAQASSRVTSGPSTASPARIIEATGTGTGTQPTDPGVSAELAASRYRADVAAGYEVEEPATTEPRASASSRRVPVDAQASSWLGSPSQARPATRSSTGSREWEGPRRFEAYAATQRRRPPTSVLVAGGAIAFAVVLLGVFLLPGFLMGGAAATATPAATELAALVAPTDALPDPTLDPQRTARPERTVKPQRMYTVKSGDTLIKIARRFKVSVDALTCVNRIRNPNNVAVGRRLAIPPKGYRCD